ncbi:N(4)-(beta-N-acetylglucosaminyl)-L-asparaginase [Polaribacter vadi]|uniref:isoaspartyl peptidase/L-asparaginase family protein n=1 Tax=Polaribacter TaxID=52959 RepID=UPI001C084147|nr:MULTISPECIES: N(4)-(beta-N-acetylglucosaminyl)-L-asparaginase [Polaribacter]MBU3010034.1 N(4)-(beta-N-acetylglucosaminyl)-L-asparaginase [Polaribacter vadi]MDO6739841.1 N(4)-(beta-N-acetylglucosaminyl)-L-asparaginase [Polaribacter sp. 1_MG-2023]
MERRKFIKKASVTGLSLVTMSSSLISKANSNKVKKGLLPNKISIKPLVIATWRTPLAVNTAAALLEKGSSALDAVEQGCRIEEADIKNQSVGKGGLPDRDGNVTLDACIMDDKGNYGSVLGVKNIKHVISVARKVMEDTPHVMLVGDGAEQFAVTKGFKRENLLTEASKKAWEEWKVKSEYKPIINIENHDTIGMLAIDKKGNISGACTTSGLAYKMAGRVGDSPIIGGGLFVDNEIGGAAATGLGEEVLKTVGSFLIVELMRQGKSPQEACEEAIARIVSKPNSNYKNFQVGYIAVNKQGETGAYSIHEWFSYNLYQKKENKNIKSDFYNKD